MAATEESLQKEIDEQTTLFNQLKASADPALASVKEKLAELKKNLNQMRNAASGGRDAGKKKERLLLKTAKVCGLCRTVSARTDT